MKIERAITKWGAIGKNDHFKRVPKTISHFGGSNNIFADCISTYNCYILYVLFVYWIIYRCWETIFHNTDDIYWGNIIFGTTIIQILQSVKILLLPPKYKIIMVPSDY